MSGAPTPVVLGVIGDVHARKKRLRRVLAHLGSLPRLDAILLVGDLSREPPRALGRKGPGAEGVRRDSIEEVLEQVSALEVPVRWVPGNHDPPVVELPGNIDGRVEQLAGLRIGGIGGAGPARFGFPYEWDEDDIRALELPPCDVLISHTPPRDTPLDVVAFGGHHVGSAAIRERALAMRGALVCGHIHESGGGCVLGDTLCVNVGALGAPHGRTVVCALEVTRAPAADRYRATLWDLEQGTHETWEHVVLRGTPTA